VHLHRIIPIAAFAPDPDWSRTQVVPPLLAGTTSATDIAPIQASGVGTIYWTAIPYDGAIVGTSLPSSGVGLTVDARLVYTSPGIYTGGSGPKLVVGRKSPGEVELALIPVGREIIEAAPPSGTSGVLQMLALAGAPPPGTTHVWLFWSFERAGSK
jgi:hypothetical protein